MPAIQSERRQKEVGPNNGFKTYALYKGAKYYFEKGIEGVERNGDLIYSAAGGMGLAAEADASEFTGEPATPSDMPKEEIKRTGNCLSGIKI